MGDGCSFERGDQMSFDVACARLLDRYDAWAVHRPDVTTTDRSSITVLLQYRLLDCDGDLVTWTADDVANVFHGWLPMLDPIEAEVMGELVESWHRFFAFLDEEGLLPAPADDPSALHAELEQHRHCLNDLDDLDDLDELDDETSGGFADALVEAMIDEGVDITDERDVQRWIEDFNNRPRHERDAVLIRSTAAIALQLPARPRPDADEVRLVAEAAPILERFGVLAEYFRDEHGITQKGNLKLADAKALVGLLDTGDVSDQTIGGRVFKTKSIEDLPRLDALVVWAKAAGVLRIVRGRIVATKKWPKERSSDPVKVLARAAAALLDRGALSLRHLRPRALDLRPVYAFLDDGTPVWLAELYRAGGPLEFDPLAEQLGTLVAESFRFGSAWNDDDIVQMFGCDLAETLDALDEVRVVRWIGAQVEEGPYGMVRRHGGAIELTVFGLAFVQQHFPSLGYDVPIAEPFTLTASAEPSGLVAGLYRQAELGGPDALVEAFGSLGNHDTQQRLIGAMWRVDVAETEVVLTLLGEAHSDKRLKKAARKALMQHRSWMANQR